jgi:hypothetical protein
MTDKLLTFPNRKKALLLQGLVTTWNIFLEWAHLNYIHEDFVVKRDYYVSILHVAYKRSQLYLCPPP